MISTKHCSWCIYISQGTVLLSPATSLDGTANSCSEFEVSLFVLFSTGVGVRQGFQGTVYVASSVQNAIITEIKDKVTITVHTDYTTKYSTPPTWFYSCQESLAAGEEGLVTFQYLRHPEFLHIGTRVLFREGQTKGVGQITRIIPKHETLYNEGSFSHKRKPSS